ncbi:NlpC/P60 family protein [uncultured Ruminococcus sp.]|uniref:C40 family peptidase n=1 Tax=uncultured Ruminococcus sp. TaxID=165186 RepID=UPI0025F4917C|nr:NlpC/P60 family protein [uncultured Ruminococcus sp.]
MIYKKHSAGKLLALCLALTLTAGMAGEYGGNMVKGAADPKTDTYESELEDLKAQQKQLDKKIEDAQAEIDKQKGDIEALKEKYTAVKAKIDNVEEQLAKNEDAMIEIDIRLRESRQDLEVKNTEIDAQKRVFLDRLKTMYLAGGSSTYENVLVNSADFFDVLMRMELVKRVAEHDDKALDDLMTKKREIEAVQAEIEKSSEKLKEQSSQYSAMRDELKAEKASLQKIIEEADGKLDTLALDKAAMELRASQLDKDYDSAYSKAHTTTVAPVIKDIATEGSKEGATKVTTTSGEEKKGAATTKKSADTKTTVTTEKPEETKKTTTEKAETKKTTTTTTTTEAQTEPPVETVPPETETEPIETEPQYEPEPEPEPEPYDDSRQSKIDTVMDYARSNVGGAYVWNGASYRACDCSGLVMLSYSQIGINMPHLASLQAGYGTAVSYDELQEGDLVFFSYGGISDIYHVAIYAGNGRIVHAANSNDGIIFSDLASFSYWGNPIVAMRRII